MAKPKPNDEKTDTKIDAQRSAKEQAWLDAEAARIAAQDALDKANEAAAAAASALAEEKIAEKKNAVPGPGGVFYTIQKTRKPKPGEEPADGATVYPYTLRRAPTLRV